jgi:tryptophanyl-tRNA synthetase
MSLQQASPVVCHIVLQINKYAFSGGGATLELHKLHGANLDVDVPWKYLNFFEEDDKKLADIGEKYGSGEMPTGNNSSWELGNRAAVLLGI